MKLDGGVDVESDSSLGELGGVVAELDPWEETAPDSALGRD